MKTINFGRALLEKSFSTFNKNSLLNTSIANTLAHKFLLEFSPLFLRNLPLCNVWLVWITRNIGNQIYWWDFYWQHFTGLIRSAATCFFSAAERGYATSLPVDVRKSTVWTVCVGSPSDRRRRVRRPTTVRHEAQWSEWTGGGRRDTKHPLP